MNFITILTIIGYYGYLTITITNHKIFLRVDNHNHYNHFFKKIMVIFNSDEDEFCPECNNYIGKKGSFITVFYSIFYIAERFVLNALKVLFELLCGEGATEFGTVSG